VLLLALGSANRAGEPARDRDHDYDPPAPGSYRLPVIKPAADGDVLDTQGRPLRLRDLTLGRVTVMSFIYTRCTDAKACPYATSVLRQLHELSAEDRALTAGLRLISISFDPEADTPGQMAAFSHLARTDKPAAQWRFLTTASQKQLQPLLDAYGQAVNRKQDPKDPAGPLNHNLRVILIDRDGAVRNIYSSGTLDVRLVLADVKTLLLEASRESR
jgi:cytochrome oxidase Cu insertion factor (SCO1/SenC/PrrC family)